MDGQDEQDGIELEGGFEPKPALAPCPFFFGYCFPFFNLSTLSIHVNSTQCSTRPNRSGLVAGGLIPLVLLKFGNFQLATPLMLAPIAGYCDLAFRIICRQLTAPDGKGIGLACTDLLSPQGLLRGSATSLDLAATNDLDKPVGMQLYGADPAMMAEGALWAVEHGANVVDINMGCPVDKVTKKDGGSRLLCIPDIATEIVRACVRVLEPHGVPLTCKMRLGWFNDHPVAEWLAPRLVDAGACAITIHGRTTEQKFQGEVNHDGIARVVQAVGRTHHGPGPGIPVIGNGDIRAAADVLAMMERTGCAGVMIGRGALSAPWIFRDAWHLISTGESLPEPSDEIKIEIIRSYVDLMARYRTEQYAMVQIRRRITWFGKRINGGACKRLKRAVSEAADRAEVHSVLDRYLAGEFRGGRDWDGPTAAPRAADSADSPIYAETPALS